MRKLLLVLSCGLALAACSSDSTDLGDAGGAGRGAGSVYQGGGRPGVLSEAEKARLTAEMIAAAGSDRVFFATDAVAVDTRGQATLQRIAAWMKKNPTVTFLLEGHADERGTREYNLALGERRAESMRSFLAAEGIQSSRLQTVTYGKERPDAIGSNQTSWAKNRRGVVVIQ